MDSRRMCPHCRAFITDKDKVCPYCNEPVGPRAIEHRGDDGPSLFGGGLFVCGMILLINLGLYAVTVVASMKRGNPSAFMNLDGGTLFLFGAKRMDALLAGQWWRLITAGFLHGGILHIFMNLYGLMQVGPLVESFFGPRRMVVIYTGATAGGFLLSAFWSRGLSVGASAGLFGLMGAALAITSMRRGAFSDYLRSSFLTVIGANFIFGALNPVIDNAAHLGGLAAGFLLARIAGEPKLLSTHPLERLWTALAILTLAIVGLSYFRWALWLF